MVSYGNEPQSSFRFSLSPAGPLGPAAGPAVSLPFTENPKKRHLDPVAGREDQRVYRAAGGDPWLQSLVDLSMVPAVETGIEQWITLRYRCDRSGEAQFFFAAPGERFAERRSVRISTRASRPNGPDSLLRVPVVGIAVGSRLGNLRFDPPVAAEIELLEMRLSRRPRVVEDYLVRLTTQFRWFRAGPLPLRVEADSQVLLESVVLRAGD